MALAALPLIALLAATLGASLPGESACYKIREADLKNYCLATVRHRASDCYNIKSAYVYILRCADGTLYTGHTNDPDARLQAHNDGIASHCTATRRPVELVNRVH